jgi:hypothetical protein
VFSVTDPFGSKPGYQPGQSGVTNEEDATSFHTHAREQSSWPCTNSVTVTNLYATRLIRKMRGAAQAHLLECDDGHSYVVKFQNNPQHRRILVNEWLASSLLAYLQISTPEIAIVHVTPEFLALYPDVHIQLRSSHLAIEPGQHFGSRYPCNPSEAMVYDFLPDVLLDRVVNINEFLGALVLDKWTGNGDARQAIFGRFRTQRSSVLGHQRPPGFSASMIDQGYAFGGSQWTFSESPLQGLYFRPMVYRNVRSLDDFQPWLDRVVHFPETVLDIARTQIPPKWILGDKAALDALLKKLIARCKRVPDLIEDSIRARVNPFPAWLEADARSADSSFDNGAFSRESHLSKL